MLGTGKSIESGSSLSIFGAIHVSGVPRKLSTEREVLEAERLAAVRDQMLPLPVDDDVQPQIDAP